MKMTPQSPSGSGSNNTTVEAEISSGSRNRMIESLGEALDGINIGLDGVGNGFTFEEANEGNGPLTIGSASSHSERDLAWGPTLSTGTSKSRFSNSSSAHGSLVGQEEAPPEPKTPVQDRNSFDLFLSQSPSQALGGDLLKHYGSGGLSKFGMTDDERQPAPYSASSVRFGQQGLAPGSASSSVIGDLRSNSESRRKSDSPSCSVTGTTTSTSRSVSPYANSGDSEIRRTIQAYQGYEAAAPVSGELLHRRPASFAEDDRNGAGAAMSHGFGSHPQVSSLDSAHRVQSPFGSNSGPNQKRAVGFGSPYDQSCDRRGFRQPGEQAPTPQQVNPQQQVLYMAVPTPDGRGQVLQPIQMVQLPGKPFAYVVPGAAGMAGAAGIAGVPQSTLAGAAQPMMVFPTMTPHASGGHASPLAGGAMRHGNDGQNKYGNYVQEDGAGLGNREDYLSPARNDAGGGNQYGASLGNQSEPMSSLYSVSVPQRPPLETLLGQVRRLSRDQVGCRLVQQALDEEGPMAATLILNEGLPFWGEAMVDPFGNYLFQKILEKITAEERVMLVKSVSTRLVNASLNLHGTRSVQKVVELCAVDEENGENEKSESESAADILTQALAPAAARLCIDSHGNHVIQRILLKLGQKHSKFVFDAVAASVSDVARHRHGCCVIQRCLDSPQSESRSHLVRRIVDKALELMQDAYGNYVVQYVLDVCSDEDVQAVCESVVGKVNLLAIQKFSSNVMEKCLERCSDRVKEYYMQELGDHERIRELMMDPFGNYVVQRALSVATHAQAVRLVEAMRPHLIASQPGTPGGQRNGGMRNTAGGRRIMAKICRRFPNFSLTPMASPEELYSQSKGHHRHNHQAVSLPSYGRIPAGHHGHGQQFGGDQHLARAHLGQRQQFYDFGGAGYYDHMHGHGGFPGM